MGMKDKPNKVTTVLKVIVTGEFYDDDSTEETLRYAVEQDLEDAGFDVDVALLKEHELPTELKQKMWNALYAEEDEYEKKFVGKEEHLNWFTVYRPWLQKGFDIAINAIADWEGR